MAEINTLPKEKQTVPGLYATAREAYEKWKAQPENVLILDVRTPEEFLFVGHFTMAWKIPVAAQSYEWDADKARFPMNLLPSEGGFWSIPSLTSSCSSRSTDVQLPQGVKANVTIDKRLTIPVDESLDIPIDMGVICPDRS